MSRRTPTLFVYVGQVRHMEHKDLRNIYIGRLIQEKVEERNMSYAEFARQIHCGRPNVYRIFNSKSIDVERLLLISEVLDYDFIHEVYFPEYMTSHLPPHLLEELKAFLFSQPDD